MRLERLALYVFFGLMGMAFVAGAALTLIVMEGVKIWAL